MSFARRALGLGVAAAATLTPLAAATTVQAAPADQHGTAQAQSCGYDICTYTGKKYTGTMRGYNHYKTRR